MMINDLRLTRSQERCLRDQEITADQPGPVLHDFQMLLDFLGAEGVPAAGKHNLLPIKHLGELDRRLSRPIRLEMKRPLLRSHPYLQGLNLLLRASGLGRVAGTGSKARLVLDPDLLAQWDRLNPTERYFNLLEAWLRIGRPEMVGERASTWGDGLLFPCLLAWKHLPEDGHRFDTTRPQEVYLYGISRDFYKLALMDLFGLVAVEQPPPPVGPWFPAGVRHRPFGDAVFTRLAAATRGGLLGEGLALDEEEALDEEDDPDVGAPDVPWFGAWQPLFQPYFPDWRQNLELPEPELRAGQFVFRVSLGTIWRRIALPAEATLDDLLSWILRSVQFDSDHLYQFTYRDRLGSRVAARHPYSDEGPWADQMPIGRLPLEPGQSMDLLYDFGDSWRFTVTLERIDPPAGKGKALAPRILERHGKAPPQYPNWDE